MSVAVQPGGVDAHRPKIMLIGTGGTISSVAADPFDVLDYADGSSKLDTHALLARVPDSLRAAYDITPVSFSGVNSPEIGPAHWLALAELIQRSLDKDPDLAGIVVTHGTATLEETAYVLNLVLRTDRPVVLTAAQRPDGALGADGPANLAAALRTAAAEGARGMGVLVVLNDEIHAARHVTKATTYRLNTFQSPEAGPIGAVDGDGPRFHFTPLKLHTNSSLLTIGALAAAPRVDISYAYSGADGVAVDAFVGAGARGIVTAGMLPGMVPKAELAALFRARDAGCVIVQSVRAPGSRVAPRRFLRSENFVAADSLNPQKARILLMLALGLEQDISAIARLFATH